MTNATLIRQALQYEARNNLTGEAKSALADFAATATPDELVRFAQLIGNITEGSERMIAPPMDGADLARTNID